MGKVYEMGVIAAKSAGNQGLPSGQGLFWVDAYTGEQGLGLYLFASAPWNWLHLCGCALEVIL